MDAPDIIIENCLLATAIKIRDGDIDPSNLLKDLFYSIQTKCLITKHNPQKIYAMATDRIRTVIDRNSISSWVRNNHKKEIYYVLYRSRYVIDK